MNATKLMLGLLVVAGGFAAGYWASGKSTNGATTEREAARETASPGALLAQPPQAPVTAPSPPPPPSKEVLAQTKVPCVEDDGALTPACRALLRLSDDTHRELTAVTTSLRQRLRQLEKDHSKILESSDQKLVIATSPHADKAEPLIEAWRNDVRRILGAEHSEFFLRQAQMSATQYHTKWTVDGANEKRLIVTRGHYASEDLSGSGLSNTGGEERNFPEKLRHLAPENHPLLQR